MEGPGEQSAEAGVIQEERVWGLETTGREREREKERERERERDSVRGTRARGCDSFLQLSLFAYVCWNCLSRYIDVCCYS